MVYTLNLRFDFVIYAYAEILINIKKNSLVFELNVNKQSFVIKAVYPQNQTNTNIKINVSTNHKKRCILN